MFTYKKYLAEDSVQPLRSKQRERKRIRDEELEYSIIASYEQAAELARRNNSPEITQSPVKVSSPGSDAFSTDVFEHIESEHIESECITDSSHIDVKSNYITIRSFKSEKSL
jgi:hypothetical protein